MKKIISLFQRNHDGDRLVRNEIVPGAEWVLEGLGQSTRKWDGTCCMVRDGKLYKRFDAKRGKTPPPNFEASQEPDTVTGHHPGWVPVGDGPEDQWFRAAFEWPYYSKDNKYPAPIPDGTYEMCGPKVNGNQERCLSHTLIAHDSQECPDCPRDFDGLKAFFEVNDIEGIVWHHPDGRMVKIKGKDLGIKREEVIRHKCANTSGSTVETPASRRRYILEGKAS